MSLQATKRRPCPDHSSMMQPHKRRKCHHACRLHLQLQHNVREMARPITARKCSVSWSWAHHSADIVLQLGFSHFKRQSAQPIVVPCSQTIKYEVTSALSIWSSLIVAQHAQATLWYMLNQTCRWLHFQLHTFFTGYCMRLYAGQP